MINMKWPIIIWACYSFWIIGRLILGGSFTNFFDLGQAGLALASSIALIVIIIKRNK